MKTNFKKISFVLATALIVAAPSLAFAQDSPSVSNSSSTNSNLKVTSGATNFCTNLTAAAAKAQTSLTDKETKLRTQQTNVLNKLATKKADQDAKLQGKRTDADSRRQMDYAKLGVKATTDAQKQAVLTFQTTINSAIQVRRAAVDAAIAQFRTDASALITSHQGSVNAASANFTTAVNAAIAKAQASCAAGTAPKIVRTTLVADLKTARTNFKADKNAQANIKPQIQALEKIKNAAIAKAVADFAATAKQARTTLKAALK